MMQDKADDKHNAFARKAVTVLNEIVESVSDAIFEHELDFKQDGESAMLLANGVFAALQIDGAIGSVIDENNFKQEHPQVFNEIPQSMAITPTQFAGIIKAMKGFLAQDSTSTAVRDRVSPLLRKADNFYSTYNGAQADSAAHFKPQVVTEKCFAVYAKLDGEPVELFKQDVNHVLYGVPFETEEDAQAHLESTAIKGSPTIAEFNISATKVRDLIDGSKVHELASHLVKLDGEDITFQHGALHTR